MAARPTHAEAVVASGDPLALLTPRRHSEKPRSGKPSFDSAPLTGSPLKPERAAARDRAGDAWTLAAEVAALDAVQSAIDEGSFRRAVSQLEQYRRDFPQGQLTRDADALVIDALRAARDEQGPAREVERFVLRYPSDPRAARIRRLTKPLPATESQP